MLFLFGLLLLVGSGAFTALVIAGILSGGPDYAVSVLGHHIATLPARDAWHHPGRPDDGTGHAGGFLEAPGFLKREQPSQAVLVEI
ncbi:hypothetical protein [Streptomyces sp. NPDC001450]